MGGSFVSLKRPASLGCLLLALALLLRIAVPSGYMFAGDGSLALVPCPSQTMAWMPPNAASGDPHAYHHAMAASSRDPDGHGSKAPARKDGAADCPFSVAAAPALPPAPPSILGAPPALHIEPEQLVLFDSTSRLLAAPPPPSRGPPSLA